MPESNIAVRDIFEAELNEQGIEFETREDGRYALSLNGGSILVALDNAERAYARNGDADAVRRFVASIVSGTTDLPGWSEARVGLFSMMESAAVETGPETVTMQLSDKAMLVLAHFSAASGTVRFIRSKDLDAWEISEKEAWEAADSALDTILSRVKVSFLDANDLWLGVIEANEPYKASLIRAKSLRHKVQERLGWPIYAVAPSRGFVYLISKADEDQLGRIGAAVVKEFKSAEYSISTEVWEVGDNGIHAFGEFPTE